MDMWEWRLAHFDDPGYANRIHREAEAARLLTGTDADLHPYIVAHLGRLLEEFDEASGG